MLAQDRCGALIVFEGSHGLLNYSLTGTKLSSHIHADILYSIFQQKSPLHDGAVILYQDRIQAAGCFLPLSKTSELDKRFGTRHRAALGVSEVSDAIVVIVSEETGEFSICQNGRMNNFKDIALLRKMLRQKLISGVNQVDLTLREERG